MKEKKRNWTREETILAFDLYCRIPFSKISKTNLQIVELASIIGRTPSSVGLKMANLARFDSELHARNISGMRHGSKMDEIVWNEFCNNWEELSYQAQRILAEKKKTSIEKVTGFTDIEEFPIGKTREQLIKARVGQYFFRASVLSAYSNKCCITNLAQRELLVASHIKPWKESDEKTERTNPSNGLCLNSLHDKAFDCGLITIDFNYDIIVSDKLKDAEMDLETRSWLKHYEHNKIMLPDRFLPGKKFIEYHNDVIFLR